MTRWRVSGLTLASPLITRETVERDTPHLRAMSSRVRGIDYQKVEWAWERSHIHSTKIEGGCQGEEVASFQRRASIHPLYFMINIAFQL
jgi:hypothetical protein